MLSDTSLDVVRLLNLYCAKWQHSMCMCGENRISLRQQEGQLPHTDCASAFVSTKNWPRLRDVVDTKNFLLIYFKHQAKSGCCMSYHVYVCRRFQTLGCWGPFSWDRGCAVPLETCPSQCRIWLLWVKHCGHK